MLVKGNWTWLVVCALGLGACAGQPAETDAFVLPPGNDIGAKFETSASDNGGVPDTVKSEPDVQIIDTESDVPAAADEASADVGVDAASVDTGPAPVTSCKGHCFLVLEDNPCSCNQGCIAQGNCCLDFESTCKCATVESCNDQSDCTSDSCVNGYCKNIPTGGSCCGNDSECTGGNACKTAKCLNGICGLVEKPCDDGFSCTTDFCDVATGTCAHGNLSGTCFIDGACRKAGDVDPSSAGCASCDPAKDTKGWSLKPATCSIDGKCIKSGEVSPAATCAVCDSTKATDKWSVKSGNCFISDKCFANGAPNPDKPECEICDAGASPSNWSGKPGLCAIDGKCYPADTPNPASPDCSVCDPTKSKSAWSVKNGFCSLEGKCVADGKAADGSFGCKICDAKKPDAWVFKTGNTCDDGLFCTSATKCDATGACVGNKVPNCCTEDASCVNLPSKPESCQKNVCNKSSGKCEIAEVANCCAGGVCCDIAAGTYKPQKTVCNNSMALGLEYQCNGQAVEKRSLYPGCTGASPSKCSGDAVNLGYGSWLPTGKVCKPDGDPPTVCTLKSADIPPDCAPK